MDYKCELVHYVVVTVIVMKDGKFLVAKRAPFEKAFPNAWTVPGGKLETQEYMSRPKDTTHHWYNVFEDVARREVREEIGIEIKDLQYLTSMVYVRPDGVPCVIVSLFAEYAGSEVRLCSALTEARWVSFEELKGVELIDGLYEEFVMLDARLREECVEWSRR